MKETLSLFYESKLRFEGPDLKEFAEKICTNIVTLWWDSKERPSTQGKRKNYKDHKTKQKRKRLTLLLMSSWVI